MKKIVFILLFPSFLFSIDQKEFRTDFYLFSSVFEKNELQDIVNFTNELNTILNSSLNLTNRDELREIEVLENIESYHDYLKLLDIPQRDDFVFLEFNNKKSKVVMYKSEKMHPASLAHHLTLQYLDFYGKGAPLWFNIGIAVYFEDFRQGKPFTQNNRWLDTLKKSNNKNSIFTTLINSNAIDIKPYNSWILIDYLINTDIKEYNRLLWDSLSLLKYNNEPDKQMKITQMFTNFNLDEKLEVYLQTMKGYNDYMDLAIEKYQSEDYLNAIELFKKAIIIEPRNYSPEYYIGLCYSNLENYQEAYSHLSNSLDKNAPKDIVYYSIGISFYKNKEFTKASKYLSKIEDKLYQGMAEKIFNEISKY